MRSKEGGAWRRMIVKIASSATSPWPRVKGFGILINILANVFRSWDVELERRVFGYRMLLNPSDIIGNMLLFAPNYYDHNERRLVREIVQPDDLVVDVGANIGAYTLTLAGIVGAGGTVISIEAERRNASKLRESVASNGMTWVEVHEVGVSDREETLEFHLNSSGNAGAHSFFAASSEDGEIERTRCVSLASLLPTGRSPKLMKMDIEGFEFRVLSCFFEQVPEHDWPEYLLLEDAPAHREGDIQALCELHGYTMLRRYGLNIFLARQPCPAPPH